MAENLPVLDPTSLRRAMTYIDGLWKKLERYNPHDDGTLVGLPNPYIVPSMSRKKGFSFQEQYYWDSYFTILGLIREDQIDLARGMVENLLFMQKRFGIVPNGSRFYFTSRSQPPFLTSMILEIYERTHDKKWLAESMTVAKEEYRTVWMSSLHPNWRKVYRDLSRFYDVNVLHDLAEAESGMDMNPRFGRKSLDFIPVDLNSLLFKYETDFARASVILGDENEAKDWYQQAHDRKQTMMELMWNPKAGFFFDYNYVLQKQGNVWSLAGFYPLWAGMLDEAQAHSVLANLRKFEHVGGLVTVPIPLQRSNGVPEQWGFPNGWAPLHWLVVEGLIRYGYHEEAKRIAYKWLATCMYWFEKDGLFYEKYNVVEPTLEAKDGVYPTQIGFGWTNAVFTKLVREFVMVEAVKPASYESLSLKHSPMSWIK